MSTEANQSEGGEIIRRDSLGRRITAARLANLRKFQPGESGNPGGSYSKRTLLDAITRQMKKGKVRPTDSVQELLDSLRAANT